MTQTIMFTDVESSSKLRRTHGEAAAQKALSSHSDLIRAQLREHRGREVKTFGDGFLVSFTSAKDAVGCAISIQQAIAAQNLRGLDRLPHVRIGINIGEVIEEDGDVFGLPVDAAEHIQGKAKAGQILVSELVRGVVGAAGDMQFIERGRVKLKNFPERWRLYEVPWQADRAGNAAMPRALLIADLTGTVSMFDRLGDEASLETVRAFYAIARAHLVAHPVDWTKTAADTFLASFRSADAALTCAIGMQRAFATHRREHARKPLRVRIALHYGDVVREADELFGHTLVVAVLMSRAGRAGEILASSTFREQVAGDAYAFGRGKAVDLQGLSDKYVVHRVRWN